METHQPKLRFPEFEDDWNNFTLEQLTDKVGDGLHGTPEYVDNSDVYFINGNNLIDGKIVISETSKKVSLETFTKNNKGLNSNSILISINGTIGSISRYNNEKIMLGKSVGYFNFKQSKDFYFHILQSNKVQDYFVSELTGSTIKNLSLKTLRETNIYQPLLEEQTRIANFLSAVDEKLNLLKEKKSLLEDYKKGVMQKIFNQEIRFKDDNGNDYVDWEEKKLRDITTLITKGTTPKNFVNEGVNYVKIECIDGKNLNLKKCLFIEEETHNKELKRSILEENDILFAIAGSIGKSVIIKKNHLPANTNQALSIIRLDNNQILDFVFQVLNSEQIKKYIQDNISVGAQPNLNLEQVGSYAFNCPKSYLEQTKIANFLTSIDEKIELVSNQIQDTQEYKKGLLQQMFV